MDPSERELMLLMSRRNFLRRTAGVGIGMAALGGLPALLAACGVSSSTAASTAGGASASAAATAATSAAASTAGGPPVALNVLAPAAPDPAPPGVAKFSDSVVAAFQKWQTDNNATVTYDAPPWPQLHDKMQPAFASGNPPWDVIYMSGWVPEFANNLVPIADMIPADLKADLPPSSFSTTTWNGKTYGVVFTLSLLTLFYNTEHFAAAGIKDPPKTWADLKTYVKELTKPGQYGWVLNYGAPEGIGGTASYWMAYLQQAGGKMYGPDGMPVFNDTPGVDALQLMLDLYKAGTDPGSISYVGINDATNVFTAGKASMMMNWPFTWVPAQDPKTSKVVGKVGDAVLPAGPAGSASIDGTDAWTIASTSKNPDLAMKLIEFYLDPAVQKSQAIDTGWLPIRLSMLNDPEVQAKATNAVTVLAQSKYPYDSFVTPDYNEVTQAVGTEIAKALKGQKSAAQAIKDASDQVTAIVKKRS
ncbi:MAG: ABC transporter substrate-binding protein [Gaiellaceae bacterium]